MGSKKGSGYVFKRGKYYYVRIKTNGKDIFHSLKTGNKEEAQKLAKKFVHPFVRDDKIATLHNIQAQIATEEANVEKDEKILIKKMVYSYLSHKTDKISDGTVDNYFSMANHFIKWFDKSIYVCDVKERDAIKFYEAKREELVKERLNATIFTLRRIWRVLMKYDNNIRLNPWETIDIKQKKGGKRKRRELTAEEIVRLMDSAKKERFTQYWGGETFMLFAIGAYTAMRLMDCVHLRWSEVGEKVIVKLPQKTAENGQEAIIPICDNLRLLLAQWRASGNTTTDYVLPILHGLHRRKINKMVHNVFEDAQIPICEIDANGKRKIRTGFHSLRVHGLSEFMRLTGNIAVVQTIAGHAHPDMTLWYTHQREMDVIKAVEDKREFSGANSSLSAETIALIGKYNTNGENIDQFVRNLLAMRETAIVVENKAETKQIA